MITKMYVLYMFYGLALILLGKARETATPRGGGGGVLKKV